MRRQRARRFVALAAVALLASGFAACGDDDDDDDPVVSDDETEETEADGAEVTVKIDGKADDFDIAAFGYFPSSVTVHPGDTVVYESVFSGEPHSITFGTIVSDAITEFRKLTPEQLESEGPPPPELDAAFAKIPGMLPEGPGDANQISVNPCFVASGDLAIDDSTKQCEVTEPAPFTGTETFYNSGFLPDGETFEVTLADDIEPGTYVGFCVLHFTEMISEITVVADDEDVPSAEEVAEEGQAQLDELIAKATPAFEGAQEAAEPNTVAAGVSAEDAPIIVTEFLPADLEVAAGDQITWNIDGPHTVSFNAPEEARTLITKGDDGGYHLTESAVAPAGYEPPPPPEEESEGPPPPLEGGTWDGTGFFSSGIAFFGPFTLTISEPGTYEYVCLIHPEMEGTVTVS